MRIFNSLSGTKQEFRPLGAAEHARAVKIYVCGVTPQDSPHLGHAVASLRFAVLRRYLRHRGYEPLFVQNETDVDDKIIARARQLGLTPRQVAQRYGEEYSQAMSALGIEPPDRAPRVSEYVPQIISYIARLIERGYAYATEDGEVYYDVSAKPDYGKLSHRRIGELRAGTRVAVEANKRDPLDFALWKHDTTEGASWPSPWGPGRPGWHIECSAMSNAELGPRIDIHGGGLDLLFPHHENELAQCEAHNGEPFSQYWMHSGLLTVNGSKMSKSVGNFITVDRGLKKYGAELFRYVVLTFHFRSNIDVSDELFSDNLNALRELHAVVEEADRRTLNVQPSTNAAEAAELQAAFEAAMDDDLNTAVALVALTRGAKRLEQLLEVGSVEADGAARALRDRIRGLGQILGLLGADCTLQRVLQEGLRFHASRLNREPLDVDAVERKLVERAEARGQRDYARADQIREELFEAGVDVRDARGRGTEWGFATLPK